MIGRVGFLYLVATRNFIADWLSLLSIIIFLIYGVLLRNLYTRDRNLAHVSECIGLDMGKGYNAEFAKLNGMG